ncbi:pB345L [African swine fever virus]|uniref:PB345L n=1 Tax=African swine fever virus TaxID=10497 RepID=A0A894KS69_ASF|nr:pB345L [African swine fever virus]
MQIKPKFAPIRITFINVHLFTIYGFTYFYYSFTAKAAGSGKRHCTMVQMLPIFILADVHKFPISFIHNMAIFFHILLILFGIPVALSGKIRHTNTGICTNGNKCVFTKIGGYIGVILAANIHRNTTVSILVQKLFTNFFCIYWVQFGRAVVYYYKYTRITIVILYRILFILCMAYVFIHMYVLYIIFFYKLLIQRCILFFFFLVRLFSLYALHFCNIFVFFLLYIDRKFMLQCFYHIDVVYSTVHGGHHGLPLPDGLQKAFSALVVIFFLLIGEPYAVLYYSWMYKTLICTICGFRGGNHYNLFNMGLQDFHIMFIVHGFACFCGAIYYSCFIYTMLCFVLYFRNYLPRMGRYG